MHPCMGALRATHRTAAPPSNTCFVDAKIVCIDRAHAATIIIISADPTALFAPSIQCSHC